MSLKREAQRGRFVPCSVKWRRTDVEPKLLWFWIFLASLLMLLLSAQAHMHFVVMHFIHCNFHVTGGAIVYLCLGKTSRLPIDFFQTVFVINLWTYLNRIIWLIWRMTIGGKLRAPFSSHECQKRFLIHLRPLYTEGAAKFKYNFHSTH